MPQLLRFNAGLSPPRPEFDLRPVYVGVVAEKVAVKHVPLRARQLSSSTNTPMTLSLVYHSPYIIAAFHIFHYVHYLLIDLLIYSMEQSPS